ncbi:MAG: hypothetical protein R3A44_44565 [Caldilineaceae bacterium]
MHRRTGNERAWAVHTLSIFWVAMMVSRLLFGMQDRIWASS